MQLLKDFTRPFIVTPLDNYGVEKLYRSDFDNLRCESFSISRHKLYEIFATGFFDHLNNRYDIMIGDYEEEEIVSRVSLEAILNEDISKFKSSKNSTFWNEFERCIKVAIEHNTGMFFFF